MANRYGLICTEEAVKHLWNEGASESMKEGQWSLHQGLWVYKMSQSSELDHFKFPTLDMIVVCDNVSF